MFHLIELKSKFFDLIRIKILLKHNLKLKIFCHKLNLIVFHQNRFKIIYSYLQFFSKLFAGILFADIFMDLTASTNKQ